MPRIDADELETFVTDLIVGLNAPQENAEAVASSLVRADLCGHRSHGVRLLPEKYAREISNGEINPTATPQIKQKDCSFAVVDGQRAFGHIVARKAVDTAVEMAINSGVGVTGLRNVTHIGRIGEWAERATDQEMALLAFVCNPASQWVAPPGSAERRLSTNPIAIGIPTFGALEFPLVIDVATSQVARGKISLQSAEDSSLPKEWVISDTNESISDPERFQTGEGALLPLGGSTSGHKGFGLSVMTELLATNLSDWYISGQNHVPKGNAAVFFAVDLTMLTSPVDIVDRISAFTNYLRSTTFSDTVATGQTTKGDQGLLPGEPEYRMSKKHRAEGIEFAEQDLIALHDLATKVGVEGSIPTGFE